MNERTSPPLPAASPHPANRPPAISGRDREFLPAAIEILETPPPPLSVITMLTICAFFAAALAWSFYGRLDVHAVAPGKIDTAGRAKVIQPLDPGKVAETWPCGLIEIACALVGMLMPGCTTLPCEVTMRPCASIWNEPSRV